MTSRAFTAVVAALSCSVATVAAQPRPAEPQTTSELIRQLGSPSFPEREAATRALRAREEAVAELHTAVMSQQAEIARRARAILDEFRARRMQPIVKYARAGRVDLLVEYLANAPESAGVDPCWEAVHGFVADLVKRSGYRDDAQRTASIFRTTFESRRKSPRVQFLTVVASRPNTPGRGEGWPFQTDDVYLRSHQPVAALNTRFSVIVAAGDVNFTGSCSDCIVLANGDVSVDYVSDSVVVADGTLGCNFGSRGLLIARHDIAFGTVAGLDPNAMARAAAAAKNPNNIDLSKATVPGGHIQLVSGTHLATRGRVRSGAMPPGRVQPAALKENQRAPLGVRFFECADVGIETADSKEGVRVEKVAAGAPPAKAGLRAGDVIVAVDGQKSPDVETLRRQLRRAFVRDAGTLTVRRGDKTLELNVAFYGYELPKDK